MNIRLKSLHLCLLIFAILATLSHGQEDPEPAAAAEQLQIPSIDEIFESVVPAAAEVESTPKLGPEKIPSKSNVTIAGSKDAKSNVTITDPAANITRVNCLSDTVYESVEIVNHTRLMELMIIDSSNRTRNSKEDKSLPGACILIMFYARWCVFSSQAAPYFNAIPRFFPHLKVIAIDAMKYQNFNTQYGIVGVPTLMLVHNAKPVAKFSEITYVLNSFSTFITELTNLQPNESLYVTSADFQGPVSSVPSDETDYCLVLSWIFIAACLLYFTTKSRWWRQFVELVQNTWRESNAQHEHAE